MAKTVDLEKVLNFSAKLIIKELKNISILARRGKLDHETSQDLVRYHSALSERKFSELKNELKDQSKAKHMSTDELIAMAKIRVDEIEQKKKTTREIHNGKSESRNTDLFDEEEFTDPN